MVTATHYKNQASFINIGKRERERSEKGSDYLNRGLRKVRHSSAQLKLWKFLFRAKVEYLNV